MAGVAEIRGTQEVIAVGSGGEAASISAATGSLQRRVHLLARQPTCCATAPETSSVVVGGTDIHVLEASSLESTLKLSGHSVRSQPRALEKV